MNITTRFLVRIMILFVCVPSLVQASEWDYEIEAYLMASTIEGDAGIGRASGAGVEVDFDDILEVLHAAGMLHFEAHHNSGWGVILDYGFMDLRDDVSGPRGGVADFKVRQGVLQLESMYRVPLGNGTLDYLGGIRWWDNDLDVEVDLAVLPGSLEGDVEEDWVDIFVGARWITPINEHWDFMLRGDIGGFGLESDSTSSLSIGTKYTINESLILDMQYKGTWVDYENGTEGQPGYFSYDTVTHGPLLGLIYRF